ncbi:MAG TPA: hypothetical protein VFG86_04935 [Chloroflexota bacterium]|jgi:hypothetical protein|nr:hypothetical protein [Chloroflexota bacterium]
MSRFNMWQQVNPSPTEIEAAHAAFEGVDVVDIMPRLVMIRRAVEANFYTDDLPDVAGVLDDAA